MKMLWATITGLVVTCALAHARPLPADGTLALPLRHSGRWLTDAIGRVVLVHGVNFVEKASPFYPAARGFGDDDAAFLAAHGFNAFRLGVVPEAIMPTPGIVDQNYIEQLADSVDVLAAHDILVLLDFHQDGWGPVTHGNGMPAWATLTDGVPNPPATFPLYYVLNPAIQHAFDNFWANRPGPDGVPLQGHYATAVHALAKRFAANPHVLGYEALNEPWPGTDWNRCITGCSDLEDRLLVPFYQRVADAVHAATRRQFVFGEPFVLFNFGRTDTALPRIGAPRDGLAVHVYALSAQEDLNAIDHAVAGAERSGAALLVTEWGATTDGPTIARLAGQLDSRLAPWLFWAYFAEVIRDPAAPPTPDNLNTDAVAALTRPFPAATNGTPTALAFDPAARTLDFTYAVRRPDGRPTRNGAETVVMMPTSVYPSGYTAAAAGATVISAPDAPQLRLRNERGAATVSLHAAPRQ